MKYKELEQEKLEQGIKRTIEEKISRVDLAKELNVSLRTLEAKIIELENKNPELYAKYIEKFPYKPKKREDIDFEALVIEMIKTGQNREEIAAKYDVSSRTIARRIKELEKTNPELIELYRIHANDVKKGTKQLNEMREKVDELTESKVKTKDATEIKEDDIRQVIDRFEELVESRIIKIRSS